MNLSILYLKYQQTLPNKEGWYQRTFNNCMPHRQLLFEDFAKFVINEYKKSSKPSLNNRTIQSAKKNFLCPICNKYMTKDYAYEHKCKADY